MTKVKHQKKLPALTLNAYARVAELTFHRTAFSYNKSVFTEIARAILDLAGVKCKENE